MKRLPVTVLAIAPALLALGACNSTPAEAPMVDNDAELATITQIQDGQAAAFAADDAEGATNIYAADATFAASGAPVMSGLEAIRAAFDEMLGDPNSAVEIKTVDGWVAASGDLATTTSDYTYSWSGEDGKVMTEKGFNQTLWRKDGGTWKIVVDSNTPVSAPEEAAAAVSAPAPTETPGAG